MVRVEITEKGKKAYEVSTKGGPVRRILSILDAEERKTFQSYLERIMAKARDELGLDRDNLPPSE